MELFISLFFFPFIMITPAAILCYRYAYVLVRPSFLSKRRGVLSRGVNYPYWNSCWWSRSYLNKPDLHKYCAIIALIRKVPHPVAAQYRKQRLCLYEHTVEQTIAARYDRGWLEIALRWKGRHSDCLADAGINTEFLYRYNATNPAASDESFIPGIL